VSELELESIDISTGPFRTWLEMHNEILKSRFYYMYNTVFEDLIDTVDAYFKDHSHLIDYPITPRLLHVDLHKGNVLINKGRVVGILDVEESVVGHNEYDLMRTELSNFRNKPPELESAFFAEYKKHADVDEGYELRKNFYELSRALAWIKSLILYENDYSGSNVEQNKIQAKNYVLNLIKN
jgi:aminoglycoside phosphotransferase (APT) family kinase protein